MGVIILDALRSDFSPAFILWAPILIGSAAVVGFVVGAVFGVPIGIGVTFGHRWLGVHWVEVLIPIIATVTATLAVDAWPGTRSVRTVVLTAVLALPGGIFVAFRYGRLAAASRVH